MRCAHSVVLALALAGCGGDDDPARACTAEAITYDTFGAPFTLDWCRGCHSAELLPGMRQNAPPDVNFDTLAEIRARAIRIRERAGTGHTMPPAGGPSDGERALLVEWIDCGAP